MKFIYIENYLKISRADKLDFFVILGGFKKFKVKHQKVILDGNCIVLELTDDSDLEFAKELFESFFADIEQNDFTIKVNIIKEIFQEGKQITILLENDEKKRIKI